MALEQLFANYDRLLVFDTETSGLNCATDEIIELGAVTLVQENGAIVEEAPYDELIRLPHGFHLDPRISAITGITPEDLREEGIGKAEFARDLTVMIRPGTLLIAYNAHFDLSFLYYTLQKYADPAILKGLDKLDLLTVYRDRRPYPHKLCDAIAAYGLEDQVKNSHRALDDVRATVAVMMAMEQERADLDRYLNLFGVHPKYGLEGRGISSVTYCKQPYAEHPPLYQLAEECRRQREGL